MVPSESIFKFSELSAVPIEASDSRVSSSEARGSNISISNVSSSLQDTINKLVNMIGSRRKMTKKTFHESKEAKWQRHSLLSHQGDEEDLFICKGIGGWQQEMTGMVRQAEAGCYNWSILRWTLDWKLEILNSFMKYQQVLFSLWTSASSSRKHTRLSPKFFLALRLCSTNRSLTN